MTNPCNPWVNRISALLLLVVIHAAGYAAGRDQVLNHPACNTNLKP
jgi:hypothetical protein